MTEVDEGNARHNPRGNMENSEQLRRFDFALKPRRCPIDTRQGHEVEGRLQQGREDPNKGLGPARFPCGLWFAR